MPDNITITQGSGTTIATEDVSGVQHQKVKIEFGEDGVATMVSASDPLPVLASIDTTGLATETKQDDIITAIEAIPGGGGAQYTEGDVDTTITGTAALVEGAANALAVLTQPLTDTQLRASDVKITLDGESVPVTGTFWQATQPVSIAATVGVTQSGTWDEVGINDSGNSITIDYNGSAISTSNPLPIQPPASGTLPVSATDLDIRPLVNTDVVTAELSAVDNAVLDTIAAKDFATQTTLAAMNAKLVSGTDIGDVTINNASGASAVNIQDGGNTITVDGTVAVTNAGITTIAGAVSGTEMQVDVLTMPTVTVNAHAVTNAGTFAVQESGAALTALQLIDNCISGSEAQVDIVASLPAGTNAIGKLAANSGVDIGDVDILSIAAGTNAIGNVGIIPRTSGGATPYKLVSAASTNATSVKGSAGQVFMITASNVNAAVRYLKFYNKASAPTVGTDVPVLTFAIPGNTAGTGTNIPVPDCGIAFGTGIALALTTESTDAGTTGVAANEIVVNLAYA